MIRRGRTSSLIAEIQGWGLPLVSIAPGGEATVEVYAKR